MSLTENKITRFITVEGCEGSGKTTLIETLATHLRSLGISVLTTREPGGSFFGDEVRNLLLKKDSRRVIGAKAELLLFLAVRAQHIEEVILPAISCGTVVICDRFNDSSVSYQGAGRNLGVSFVGSLCHLVCGSIVPDVTFYLDIDPKIGLERTKNISKENATAGEVDRIESERLCFHERVKEAYKAISIQEPSRFFCIDASDPLEIVAKKALAILFDSVKKS